LASGIIVQDSGSLGKCKPRGRNVFVGRRRNLPNRCCDAGCCVSVLEAVALGMPRPQIQSLHKLAAGGLAEIFLSLEQNIA